jgi:hypothetical protein
MSTHTREASAQDIGLRELTSSMIRFTNAVTLFSVQQMQNALGAVTDSRAVINRFCEALDNISNTLADQIDPSKQSTLKSINNAEVDAAKKAFHAAETVNPKEWMDKGIDSWEHTVKGVRRTLNTVGEEVSEPEPAHSLHNHKKSS